MKAHLISSTVRTSLLLSLGNHQQQQQQQQHQNQQQQQELQKGVHHLVFHFKMGIGERV